MSKSLEETTKELEQKADRIQRSKNTDSAVESAATTVSRLNRKVERIEDEAEELAFYVGVLESVFGKNRPAAVGDAVSKAEAAIDISDDELLEAAENEVIGEFIDDAQEAKSELNDCIDLVTDRIEAHRDDWKSQLDTARELNKIIGGDDQFNTLIQSMDSFLDNEIWNTRNTVSALAAKWERYDQRWKENSGKHGWGPFREEHDLSEETIEDLKQFTDEDPVRLSDLSVETLKGIKRVPELEEALQLELRSQ
jgi:hypothetical protein